METEDEVKLSPAAKLHHKLLEMQAANEEQARQLAFSNRDAPLTFKYQMIAVKAVYIYVKDRLEKTDTHVTFGPDEVYVVWFAKTLHNWKALLSTTLPDGMYYEVTFDGDKGVMYVDAYKKFDNVVMSLELVTESVL